MIIKTVIVDLRVLSENNREFASILLLDGKRRIKSPSKKLLANGQVMGP